MIIKIYEVLILIQKKYMMIASLMILIILLQLMIN